MVLNEMYNKKKNYTSVMSVALSQLGKIIATTIHESIWKNNSATAGELEYFFTAAMVLSVSFLNSRRF